MSIFKFSTNPVLRKAELDSVVRMFKSELDKMFTELNDIEKRLEVIESRKKQTK